MEIHVGNVISVIKNGTREENELVHAVSTITEHSYVMLRGQSHPKKVEKHVRYYRHGQIPTGILPRVVRELDSAGIEYEITDKRKKPDSTIELSFTCPTPVSTEADYSFQDEGVDAALEYERGLFHYPTGAGKTVVMGKIIQEFQVPTVIIVPSKTLLWQTHEKMCQYFGEKNVGVYGSGKKDGLLSPITVATQQSLYFFLKESPGQFDEWARTVGLLLIDECHHVNIGGGKKKKRKKGEKKGEKKEKAKTQAPANSWWQVSMKIPAYYRFGVSATIDMEDNPNNQFVLETVTGDIIGFLSIEEGIRRKVLSPAYYTMVHIGAEPCQHWRNKYRKNKATGERELIEDGSFDLNILDPKRTELLCTITEMLYRSGKKPLILVDYVQDHGKVIERMLKASKIPCVFLHGGDSKTSREEGVQAFKDGKVLIATIVKEGFDLPEIDTLVIAGGGKSQGALVQKIGRARRISPGKTHAEVWDIFDDDGDSRNGPRMLKRHSLSREHVYRKVPQDRFTRISHKAFKDTYLSQAVQK